MKNNIYSRASMILVVCFSIMIVSYATMAPEASEAQNVSQPKIMIASPDVQIGKNTKIIIKGAGFEPGTEISLLFTAIDGVIADIDSGLTPKPVANQMGEWTTTWDSAPFIKRKLIRPGSYALTAADKEYNFLTQTTITFRSGK